MTGTGPYSRFSRIMTLQLSIIVPAFNEAPRLADGMQRFEAAVEDGAVDLARTELLVIDDGSTDRTASVARQLLAPIPHHRVVTLPSNRGKGAAVRAGVSLAAGEYTAYMDADMAIDPHAIPLLVDGLATNDLTIGSRALTDSTVDATYALRSLMGRLFNRLVTTGTGLQLHDTQCGFKAFRTPVARLLFHLVRIDRFAFDVEILARARRLGLDITEVPVQWRHVPGSTIHPLHDPVSMLADVYRSRRGMLATPPVPAIAVRDRAGRASKGATAERINELLATTLDGVPAAVLAHGTSVIVLLPLVEPQDVATLYSAMSTELEPLEVSRRAMTVDALRSLGPLAGRLQAPSVPGGSG
jgi:hypothetical protein